MLISADLAKAFNEQIGHEFGASMQYVSIAAHFSQRQLTLLAKLFFEQADEEKAARDEVREIPARYEGRSCASRRFRRPSPAFRRRKPRSKPRSSGSRK